MSNTIAGFQWDSHNWQKCGKHGVKKHAIEALFQSIFAVYPDPNRIETRFRAIGKTQNGRTIFVVFRLIEAHDKILIRPISARFMHKKELLHYEKSKKE